MSEASRCTGINQKYISKVCLGKVKNIKSDFIWKKI